MEQFPLAFIHVVMSLFFGITVLYLTYSITTVWIKKRRNVKELNEAYAILLSGVLISVAIIMSSLTEPIFDLVRYIDSRENDLITIILDATSYILLFTAIGLFFALLINISSVYLFTALTHVREFEEIQKNNHAVALVTGIITVLIALFVRDSFVTLVESLIPYPDLPVPKIH